MIKTIGEINEKIKKGKAVAVTAEEIIGLAKEKGIKKAAQEVDVVTTGTFAPMCSSGAFINFGHTKPAIKASRVWLNGVQAYAGLAAVDVYLGATEPVRGDPLNSVHPGQFKYGGGHVIEDLVAGRKVKLKSTAYGTDCYPRTRVETTLTKYDLNQFILLNFRNGYQRYSCATNGRNEVIYTYMGKLLPKYRNATYSGAGEISPLNNDPDYETIGLGTRIFV